MPTCASASPARSLPSSRTDLLSRAGSAAAVGARGQPFGAAAWQKRTGLKSSRTAARRAKPNSKKRVLALVVTSKQKPVLKLNWQSLPVALLQETAHALRNATQHRMATTKMAIGIGNHRAFGEFQGIGVGAGIVLIGHIWIGCPLGQFSTSALNVRRHAFILLPFPDRSSKGSKKQREKRARGDADRLVNEGEESLRRSVSRGRPFGSEAWQKRTAKMLDLEYTFRKQRLPRS
jgi:hypothetical protein